VRAYAINTEGTTYGNQVSFTTHSATAQLGEPDMVFVEGGTFMMGCTSEQSGCNSDENPTHSVTLNSYNIGKYPVMQWQWEAVMGSNPSSFKKGDDYPVEYVSWNDVQTFITKLNDLTGKNYRLATEAEWEYAARGGNQSKGYTYSGSNTVGNVAWYSSNSGSSTHPVGEKTPNELGIYDMSGNVGEWCNDWYGSYTSSPQTNPTGPSSGSYRVLRGGSWGSHASDCRVASRGSYSPIHRFIIVGFRVVLP
jgi:formylglycine-generating enzyme required for sulfatase activity